jgi:hypothetical protein
VIDLVVVGIDWWLERHNGNEDSEWWEFKTLPKRGNCRPFTEVFIESFGGDTIDKINGDVMSIDS